VAFDCGKHVIGPCGQGDALLPLVSGAVIDAGDPGLVPADVVQDGFDDMRRDAELGHAGGDAAAQVVQDPGCELCVEQAFAARPRREGLGTEDELVPRRLGGENRLRRGAQWDDVGPPVLRSAGWKRDDAVADFFEAKPADFFASLSGEERPIASSVCVRPALVAWRAL
jgi:hypothetical protein